VKGRNRGGAHGVPPESSGFRERTAARCRSARRTPVALAQAPSTPRAGSAYSVQRSPFAVPHRPGVFPTRLPLRATARFDHRSCSWLAFGVTGPRIPFPSAEGNRLSWDFAPYDTIRPGGSGLPGGSTPRHLPPSGFGHPLDGFLPSRLGDGPSTVTASMGFSLQGLSPPGQRYPFRGLASPVVPPPAAEAADSRDSRG
jgi:hypothetical protein